LAMMRLITLFCIKNQSDIYFRILSVLLKIRRFKYHESIVEGKSLGISCGQKQTTPHFMRIHFIIVQPLI